MVDCVESSGSRVMAGRMSLVNISDHIVVKAQENCVRGMVLSVGRLENWQ